MLAIDGQLEMSLPMPDRPKLKKFRVIELMYPAQDIEIVKMATAFCDEVNVKEHVDQDTLLMTCIRIRHDVDRKHLNCFIAYEGDEPIGFLVGVASPALHRLGVVAEQKLWYITPSSRGHVAAKMLIRSYERWARLQGATQLYTGTANTQYTERTSKLLEHLGYARTGALHVKEIL